MLAWICTSVPDAIQGEALPRLLLSQASPILAALWGILVFREFKGSDIRLKVMGTLMLVLFACGLAMIALGPTLLRKD